MDDFVINVQWDEAAALEAVDDDLLVLLETAVVTTLHYQQTEPSAALSLLLTDDAHIQQYNRDYLGLDRPTDVLSFPAGAPMPGMDETQSYLGDMVISIPYAQRQAVRGGHSLTAELQLLAGHGTLHLLGYDHARPEEKAQMWMVQTAVLTRLGLDHIAPTET